MNFNNIKHDILTIFQVDSNPVVNKPLKKDNVIQGFGDPLPPEKEAENEVVAKEGQSDDEVNFYVLFTFLKYYI